MGVRHGPEPDRVLATVLFTDIVGSTEKAAALGDRRWRDLREGHHELVRRELGRFDKVSGLAVHIGARVAAAAGPGEVLVSSTVKDLVAGSGLRFQDRGVQPLKGVRVSGTSSCLSGKPRLTHRRPRLVEINKALATQSYSPATRASASRRGATGNDHDRRALELARHLEESR